MFRIQRAPATNGPLVLKMEGRLRLSDGNSLWQTLRKELPDSDAEVIVDLAGVESIDGATASLLLSIQGDEILKGSTLRFESAQPHVEKMLTLYGCPSGYSCLLAPPRPESTLEHIGAATLDFIQRGKEILEFLGDQLISLVAGAREPGTIHWRDLGSLMERAGANGLPIVLLINFLVGLIIALQSADQLARFGANQFVADLVGLSIVRELAPLMTAIVVAGRSGAAYAAELGTMKVSEEIDALRTLGLDPQRFLVFPRVLALFLVVPFLTLFGDIVGCLGGLVIAVASLEITPTAYWNQLQGALDMGDLATGLIKSGAFAITITLVACQRGLAARGGAQGVGSSTTSAVVITLFLLILLDAAFTFAFNLAGI